MSDHRHLAWIPTGKAPDVADSTLGGYENALARFRSFCETEGLEGVRAALTTSTLQRFKG